MKKLSTHLHEYHAAVYHQSVSAISDETSAQHRHQANFDPRGVNMILVQICQRVFIRIHVSSLLRTHQQMTHVRWPQDNAVPCAAPGGY